MIPTNGFSLLPSHTGLMYVYFPSPALILSSTPTRPFRAIVHPCSYTTEANAKRLFGPLGFNPLRDVTGFLSHWFYGLWRRGWDTHPVSFGILPCFQQHA